VFFFQAEGGIRVLTVTGVQTCALPIFGPLAKYLAAHRFGLGQSVDAGDKLPDGRAFQDIAEFKRLLLTNPEQIARCLTEKLVTRSEERRVGKECLSRSASEQSKKKETT